MDTLPTLETQRLLLRPFMLTDAEAVQGILSDPRVTAMLLDIPRPFTRDDAVNWIRGRDMGILRDELYTFAITCRDDGEVMGCIDLEVIAEHRRADMAYWLGSPYWNQGIATTAARRVIHFGFETLNLNRIYAQCLTENLASARVMQKAGLKYEATFRQSIYKDGRFADIAVYGLLRADYMFDQS